MTRGHGVASLAVPVPVLGLVLAWRAGWLGSGWVIASLVLFALATAVLLGAVLPLQGMAVASLERGRRPRAGSATGCAGRPASTRCSGPRCSG